MKFIVGTKINMTQKFLEEGTVVPVTAVQAGPCTVTQIKGDKDGYQAVQLGFGQSKNLAKSILGHLKGLSNHRWLKEFRTEQTDNIKRGQLVDVTTFEVGDKIKITSTSKGRGFQGVVKRHGFHGSPASHGHKDQLRMPGSIGATGPAHVFKGTRMPGRMGGDQVTVINSEVVEIDLENNIIYLKGAVPGARGSLVTLRAEGDLKVKDVKEVKAEVKETEKLEVKEDKKEVAPSTEEVKQSEVQRDNKSAEVSEKAEKVKDKQ